MYVYQVGESMLGGPVRVHVMPNGSLKLQWGVSGAWEGSEEDARALAARASVELGVPCVPSCDWQPVGLSQYSPNFGGVLT